LKKKNVAVRAELFQQFNEYKNCVLSKEYENLDNFKFWFIKMKDWPLLSSLIIGYLSVPVSGAEVERSFSSLFNILSDKRRRLTTDNLKNLLFLNFNANKIDKN